MERIVPAEESLRRDICKLTAADQKKETEEKNHQQIPETRKNCMYLMRKSRRPWNMKLSQQVLESSEGANPPTVDSIEECSPDYRKDKNSDPEDTEEDQSTGKECVLRYTQGAETPLYQETKHYQGCHLY